MSTRQIYSGAFKVCTSQSTAAVSADPTVLSAVFSCADTLMKMLMGYFHGSLLHYKHSNSVVSGEIKYSVSS